MNQRKCLKCGHQTPYEDVSPAACEACGAIYQKVEAARNRPADAATATERAPERPKAKADTPRRGVFQTRVPEHKLFAEGMRSESLYPTWRELVKWITLFWYGVALLGFVVTAASAGLMSMPTYIAFIVAAVVIIFSRATKELSLMLTDLADAAVRLAARSDDR